MTRVGEKLRLERERHATTLDAFSTTTKIEPGYLRALERDEIEGLPGPAFGKFYIRVYAEALGFDPEPLIAEYEQELLARERERLERELAEPTSEPGTRSGVVPEAPVTEPAATAESAVEVEPEADREPEAMAESEVVTDPDGITEFEDAAGPDVRTEIEVVAEPDVAAHPLVESASPIESYPDVDRQPIEWALSESSQHVAPRSRFLRWRAALIVASLAVVALALWNWSGRSNGARHDDAAGVDPAPIEDRRSSGAPTSSSSEPPSPPATPPPSPTPIPAEATTGTPGLVRVEEFGVGTGIVDRRLEGRAERFEKGSVVWFATRVLGGQPGESVRHVWLHEGRTMQTVELRLGGAHWRTHSRKTLQARGNWSVEARDKTGRLLARATFVCVPADS